MLPHTLIILMLAMAGAGISQDAAETVRAGFERVRQAVHAAETGARGVEARYEASAREMTNWRIEAAGDLEPGPLAALAALMEAGRPVVTRCVRLNNYWCIKSARWNGELGIDDEGHAGFTSAESGADAAATLLRRYFLEFGRKSALDIVRRWAPAVCSVPSGSSGPVALAVKGIGNTLRARYLASRRRGQATPGARSGRVSVVGPLALPTFRVPDIAAGMGEQRRT